MITKQQVQEALAELGENLEQVADRLLERGCKGLRKEACDCPLANYLTSKLDCSFSVGGIAAHWNNIDEDGSNIDMCAHLTDATLAFRYHFDCGHIPELVK